MSGKRVDTFRNDKLVRAVEPALVVLLFLLPLTALSAQSQASPGEKLYGVWENTDYDGGYLTFLENGYRFRWDPGGKGYGYDTDDPPDPTKENRYTIDKAWTDADGSVWLRVLAKWGDVPYDPTKRLFSFYYLMKISPADDTLEVQYSLSEFPKELKGDPGVGQHKIYYRKK